MADTPDAPDGGTETTEDITLDSSLAEAWNPEWDDEVDSLTSDQVDEDVDHSDEDEGDQPDPDEEPSDDTDSGNLYTVTVDGTEVQVPLNELLSGYSRQADYTRKTQDLATEREKYAAFDALSSALQSDPQGTIAKLARLYGIPVDDAQDTPDPLEDLDPDLAAEIREMREFRATFQEDQHRRQAAERAAQIDAEIEAVRTKYDDPKVDERELLQFAVDHQIGTLDAAYKAMRFEQQAEAKKADAAKVVERKRKAPPVEGGRNRSNGVTQGASSKATTVEEALEMALSAQA